MSTINETSDKLIKNTTANIEETKAQLASKQAFTDITDTVKDLLEEQEFKPTITIDQGTPVKIYVNKDYKFPKAAVNKSRSLK
jgi:type IV secretion system protein VirB10